MSSGKWRPSCLGLNVLTSMLLTTTTTTKVTVVMYVGVWIRMPKYDYLPYTKTDGSRYSVLEKCLISSEIFAEHCVIFLTIMSYIILTNINGQYLRWLRMFIIYKAIEYTYYFRLPFAQQIGPWSQHNTSVHLPPLCLNVVWWLVVLVT